MLQLNKKIKSPIIVVGFPGFGLVGTICTEFLLEHLKVDPVGKIWIEEMPAVVAVHKQKMIPPIGLYYDERTNILIAHAITGAQGAEWKVAEEIEKIVAETKAKEVIVLEGIGSQSEESHNIFYYTNNHTKFNKGEIKPLEEGIIIGLAGALALRLDTPLTCIFAETHSELPDSKAAAGIIQALDGYLKLQIDTKPLLELASKFEEKLKTLMTQSKVAQDQREAKMMSYVG